MPQTFDNAGGFRPCRVTSSCEGLLLEAEGRVIRAIRPHARTRERLAIGAPAEDGTPGFGLPVRMHRKRVMRGDEQRL
jgi:hypothetical protein